MNRKRYNENNLSRNLITQFKTFSNRGSKGEIAMNETIGNDKIGRSFEERKIKRTLT